LTKSKMMRIHHPSRPFSLAHLTPPKKEGTSEYVILVGGFNPCEK
jgi:hypothetical protein